MTEALHNTVAFGATITWLLMLWELRRARKVNGALARWLLEAHAWGKENGLIDEHGEPVDVG